MPTNWDSAYKAVPADSDPVGDGAGDIRDLKENIEAKIGLEHEFDYSAVSDQGMHLEGSARALVMDDDGSAPSRTPIVNDTEIGRIRVWQTATGEVKMQFYGNDTAWVDILGGTNDVTVGDIVCDSIDTGNGATEIYDMNQDLRSDDDVTFASVTVGTETIDVSTADNISFTSVTPANADYGVYIGADAGNGASTTGGYNVVIGKTAGAALTSGANNVCVGYLTGGSISTGDSNTFIGKSAGGNTCAALETEELVHIKAGDSNFITKTFPSTATENEVFDFFATFTPLNGVGGTTSCIGYFDTLDVGFIDRNGATTIRFRGTDGAYRKTVTDGTATTIGSELCVGVVTNAL